MLPSSHKSIDPCVPAQNFVETIAANVDNPNLSDADFRAFIRSSLPVVIYDRKEAVL